MIDIYIYIYIHSVKKYVGGGGALQIITMTMCELTFYSFAWFIWLLHETISYFFKDS